MNGVVTELRRMVPYYRAGGMTRRRAIVNALRWSWIAPLVPHPRRRRGD